MFYSLNFIFLWVRLITELICFKRLFEWAMFIALWVNTCRACQMDECTSLVELESSQSPHTSAKAMLFARWQHHLRFCSGFPYAPLKAIVTKMLKWSRIQDSFRITPKIESLVVCAIPDIPSKFRKDPSITFWVILHTDRQTNKPSLAKTLLSWRR